MQSLTTAVRLNPRFGVGWGLLAQSLSLSGQKEAADSAFSSAITLLPNDGSLRGQLATHLERYKEPKLAYEVLKRAYAVDPFNHRNAVRMAEYALKTGGASLAERLMTTALALDGELVYALAIRAQARMALGHLAAAADDLDKAIVKAPRAGALYRNRARIAQAMGDEAGAKKFNAQARALEVP